MNYTLSFRNAEIFFATNHQKSSAALEPFLRILNSRIQEITINSDSLGTFSGDVARPGSMLDALRGKVKLARSISDERFILVSEGSFSTTGGFGVLAQGIEILLLHDAVSGAEVLEQYISWDTNYNTATLSTYEDLTRFLPHISFGSHALVLYAHGLPPGAVLHKGIFDEREAARAFAECQKASPQGTVIAMSDMRAHCNPTRMRAITACCELLAGRLATACPQCGSGGFGLTATIPGLPCEWCGTQTQRARAETHSCVVCHAQVEKPRSDGKTQINPAECPVCNP
jgi:hypothetical protein